MKNSIIAVIIIIAAISNVAQASSPAQDASYKWQSNIEDVQQRNAFRRMEMVKIVNDISEGMKANIAGDSVADWAAYQYRGVMDANDMRIIKNIINPNGSAFDEVQKDANGNSVW